MTIRWIRPGLGTSPFSRELASGPHTLLDVRDLVDKGGNLPEQTRAMIEAGAALCSEGKSLVVCCDYGMSRSNAIAAGILAVLDGRSFEQALAEVRLKTGETVMKMDVLETVRRALARPGDPVRNRPQAILVTGGSGFLGGHLVRALSGVAPVHAPDRTILDVERDPLALDAFVKNHGIGTVIHLASPRVSTSNQAVGAAITMLKNAIEVCTNNAALLVFPSSHEIYSGYRSQALLADESLPPFPKGPYGEAKVLCESLLANAQRQGALRLLLVRFALLYGGDGARPKFLSNFVDLALHHESITTHRYRNGSPALDLLHVADAVRFLLSALPAATEGVFNVGSGTATTTADLALAIGRAAGTDRVPGFREIDSYAPNIQLDSGKAKRQLAWMPEVSIMEWLDQHIAQQRKDHVHGIV